MKLEEEAWEKERQKRIFKSRIHPNNQNVMLIMEKEKEVKFPPLFLDRQPQLSIKWDSPTWEDLNTEENLSYF